MLKRKKIYKIGILLFVCIGVFFLVKNVFVYYSQNRSSQPTHSSFELNKNTNPILPKLNNYIVYYGHWDETIVSKVNMYDLIVININSGPPLTEQIKIIRF